MYRCFDTALNHSSQKKTSGLGKDIWALLMRDWGDLMEILPTDVSFVSFLFSIYYTQKCLNFVVSLFPPFTSCLGSYVCFVLENVIKDILQKRKIFSESVHL